MTDVIERIVGVASLFAAVALTGVLAASLRYLIWLMRRGPAAVDQARWGEP